ncbi:MAG: transcription elongation factor GreA [Actinobacteria bacterium]|uniref:Transcription elongation factor GreA n=1 Tax=freshwater metagenome TaxID=449393 RepID=A0A6J6DCT1_9ZZZZ|nr:transcription elongation factor GreA [Actinomycetota bacterium]MTA89696.1 transcription elongation factor GreA [Actinomycetota bacterium]
MTDSILLTQDAYDRLRDELEQLILVERQQIAKRIQEAREEGDLKENGGYHAAKEEQGKLEARINRLEEMLANATVGEADASDGIVKQGLLVVCDINGKANEFYLGSHEIFEDTKYEKEIEEGDFAVYSPDSPIGQAIEGKKVGEKVSYSAPNGKEITVEIKQIKNFKF